MLWQATRGMQAKGVPRKPPAQTLSCQVRLGRAFSRQLRPLLFQARPRPTQCLKLASRYPHPSPHLKLRPRRTPGAEGEGRGARGSPTARARTACKAPAPLRPAAGVGTAGLLASSAAAVRGGLFKFYLWRSSGGLSCSVANGGTDPEGSRALPGRASRTAGE